MKNLVRSLLNAATRADDETAMGISLLPREVLMEILLLCPFKSLLRLRSVCSYWQRLIASKDFARLHRERWRSQEEIICRIVPIPRGMVYPVSYTLVLSNVSFEFNDGVAKVHSSSLGLEGCLRSLADKYHIDIGIYPMKLMVLDSCDGLLLLELEGFSYFSRRFPLLVCNPVTRSCKLLYLPWPSVRVVDCHWKIVYDSSLGKYKVVGITRAPSSDGNMTARCYIVELCKGKGQPALWKELCTPVPSTDWKCIGTSLFVPGKLHFLVNQYNTEARNININILSVDITTEKFTYISSNLPPTRMPPIRQFASNGKLYLITYDPVEKSNLWVLEDFDNPVWSKTQIASGSGYFAECSALWMDPVAIFDEDGKLIMNYKGEIFAYNTSSSKWEMLATGFKNFCPPKFPSGGCAHFVLHVNSFISWDNPED